MLEYGERPNVDVNLPVWKETMRFGWSVVNLMSKYQYVMVKFDGDLFQVILIAVKYEIIRGVTTTAAQF